MSPVSDDTGSAAAEFVLVGALLTLLTLAVIQFGLALHARNTVLDAAAEGARWGALLGNTAADGARRTEELIDAALGDSYQTAVDASVTGRAGLTVVRVDVAAPLPVIGLLGPGRELRVHAHAPVESLDEASGD